MNSEPQEIHQIDTDDDNVDRQKYQVIYKPQVEGDREICTDGQQYIRRPDGSLLRITEKKKGKSKKERAKERRRLKKEADEIKT